jgi:TonB family protein
MRRLYPICLVTLGSLCLGAQATLVHAGVGAAPVAGVVAPSQEVVRAKQVQRALHAKKPAKRTKAARKQQRRNPVHLAALGAPDFALYPGRMLTEEEALKSLEQELSLKVGKKISPSDYPEEARRWRWTGTTLVQVRVDAEGMVGEVALKRSSGFRVLDEQALVMVRRVSKLFVPFRLRGREHAVTVPIGFYLKEI